MFWLGGLGAWESRNYQIAGTARDFVTLPNGSSLDEGPSRRPLTITVLAGREQRDLKSNLISLVK